jgi:glycosyltransferase involved in cell wall biosynthesis
MELKVFYTAGNESLKKFDPGFKQIVEWDIDLLTGYDAEFLLNTAKDKGSHHFNGVINPNAIEKIKSYQPDAILIYGWAYASHLKIIRHFKGKIPLYFRGDSTILSRKANFKNFLKNQFLTWVYQHINTAFYVGTANKAYFKKYKLKDSQLVFAPHAIDNQRFSKDRTTEALKLRAQLNVRENDILVLFAGKLEHVKNPELLLNAFSNMKKNNVHLVFVGNGVLEYGLKFKVKNHNIANVYFMNFQNQTQMPVIYQACDLFCLPSRSETWGLAVNEAMACGKAILVSDKVGCAIDLVNDQNGRVFESENLIDLTQKLIALTQDKNTLKNKGKNAFKYIQNWSFESQVNAIATYVNR